MGWKYAPMIAQWASNAVVSGLGAAWLDDFIIGGKDKAEFERNKAEFLRRLKRYNIEVDDQDLHPVTSIKALGLELDLSGKRYRLDPAWIEKRAETLQRTAATTGPVSYRQLYQMFGTLIWFAHVAQIPLWEYAEAMQALSTIAKNCAGRYDDITALPDYARPNVDKWVCDLLANPWRGRPDERPAAFDHYVFSDASTLGQGYVEVVHETIAASAGWRRKDVEHIFLAELDALVAAASSCAWTKQTTLFCVDNTALHYAVTNGYSKSYPASCRLRAAFGQVRPWSCWIPTHLMLADEPSRTFTGIRPGPLSPGQMQTLAYIQQHAYGEPRTRSDSFRSLAPVPTNCAAPLEIQRAH